MAINKEVRKQRSRSRKWFDKKHHPSEEKKKRELHEAIESANQLNNMLNSRHS